MARETSPNQDAMTGHQSDQDRESLYVTIQEAARRCGVSSKTVQRAILAGTLPARYPQSNRCEIAVPDLELLRPGHVSGHHPEPLEQRVAALEQQVQRLELLVAELLDRHAVPKRAARAKAQESTTGPLPKRLVSLLAFAKLHNISESMVLTHMDMGLFPVERGAWMEADGTKVTLALDAKGKAALYHLYQGFPQFLSCRYCSHGYQDSVSGQG